MLDVSASRSGVDHASFNWKPAQPLADSRRDRVADCPCDCRSAGLASAGGGLITLHEMNLDRRGLVDPHDPVGIEVGLHDAPLLDVDRVVECRTGAENDAAPYLRLGAIRVDDTSV